ncbi:MAG: hypothetical protein GW818_00005 [Flavobacteriales bacterium]|nr:hypothetical protein [Flavobacteriales bacterium]PJC61549.1 MAG: hypothetical protein CO022_09300 [Flavobacteriales bacterium CG_4_9_14_0_2_um_filter_32_27]
MIRIVLYISISIITSVVFAQDSTYYTCSTCSNPLFLSSEIIKERTHVYIVHFNKADNPFRINNKEKEIHCAHCDSHTGFMQEDSTLNIIPSNVHKNGKSYDCNVCKKPLFNTTDLKEERKEAYIFNNVHDEDVIIANRSYVLVDKNLYCSFCYEKLGASKRKNKLKIAKNKVVKPQP